MISIPPQIPRIIPRFAFGAAVDEALLPNLVVGGSLLEIGRVFGLIGVNSGRTSSVDSGSGFVLETVSSVGLLTLLKTSELLKSNCVLEVSLVCELEAA